MDSKQSTMRLYDDIGNYPPPLVCPYNMYNLWRPFKAEEITDYAEMVDELDFILNHISVLCNNEDAVYEYFIRWIAQMLQFPAHKSICVTMISILWENSYFVAESKCHSHLLSLFYDTGFDPF